jgi:hypothetical protein
LANKTSVRLAWGMEALKIGCVTCDLLRLPQWWQTVRPSMDLTVVEDGGTRLLGSL